MLFWVLYFLTIIILLKFFYIFSSIKNIFLTKQTTRASGGLDWRAFRNGRLTSWLHQKRSYSLHHGNRSYFQDSKIREKLWAYDSSCVVYPLIEHYNKMPILAKLLLCQIQLSCRGYFRSSLLKWRTFLHHWYSGSRRG